MKTIIRDARIDAIPHIQKIAHETWPHAYGDILSQEQLGYMLEELYAEEILRHLIETGEQHFLVLMEDENPIAFAAFGPLGNQVYKLYKLYILPAHQRKGFGHTLVEEVIRRVGKEGGNKLLLNVNRYNNAVNFYQKIGFNIIRVEDTPIGQFWMNDYIMEIEVHPQ